MSGVAPCCQGYYPAVRDTTMSGVPPCQGYHPAVCGSIVDNKRKRCWDEEQRTVGEMNSAICFVLVIVNIPSDEGNICHAVAKQDSHWYISTHTFSVILMERAEAVTKFPLQFTEHFFFLESSKPRSGACHGKAVNQPFTCNVIDSLSP